jgi:hypothetical protein
MPPPLDVTDKGIHLLEKKMGLDPGFFASLYDEDDWSFVIKLHALLEAACTHLLMFHFNEPDLSNVFAQLELSNKTVGKIVFLGKTGLLSKEYRRFVSALSELRNNLVHDIRNSKFSLLQFVQSLDSNATKNFAISFSPFESSIRSLPEIPQKADDKRMHMKDAISLSEMIQRATTNPKLHIWLGAHATIVQIIDMEKYSDYKQWIKVKKTFEIGEDEN